MRRGGRRAQPELLSEFLDLAATPSPSSASWPVSWPPACPPVKPSGQPSRLHLFIYNGTMPRDLKKRLRAFVPPPRTVQVQTIDEPPATVPQSWFRYDRDTRQAQKHTADVPVIRCETERAAPHDVQAVLRLIDAGKVRASAKTQRATAHDSRLRSLCLLAGDRHLVVPADAESAFRRVLRELGYGLPPAPGGGS